MTTTSTNQTLSGTQTAGRPTQRAVARVVNAPQVEGGEGYVVRRPFPTPALPLVDPFLLLDHMGPVQIAPGEAKGAPDHPHRGFETVTYLLAGEMIHRDSQGSQGHLRAGDVQWMTAGAGVVHSEMPAPDFQRTGGRMHGFQLWVNLPKADKRVPPRYQDIPAARIPRVSTDEGVTVRVIAGEALGARAVIETHTPILYLHFTLRPGAAVRQAIPRDFNAFVYPFSGDVQVGEKGARVAEGQAAMLLATPEDPGTAPEDQLLLAAPADAPAPVELLLLGGRPLHEPVARYGPFVMNTRQELMEAFEDFQAGRMGTIPARVG